MYGPYPHPVRKAPKPEFLQQPLFSPARVNHSQIINTHEWPDLTKVEAELKLFYTCDLKHFSCWTKLYEIWQQTGWPHTWWRRPRGGVMEPLSEICPLHRVFLFNTHPNLPRSVLQTLKWLNNTVITSNQLHTS